ncbi:MAG: glycerate kinase [bacterium]
MCACPARRARGHGRAAARGGGGGARHILLGVGGSAMVDGGAGACARWAARCSTRAGARFRRGRLLVRLAQRSLHRPRCRSRCSAMCRRPRGPAGAAWVYGSQKGRAREVAVLEAGLARLGQVLADQGRDPGRWPARGRRGLAGGLLGRSGRSWRPASTWWPRPWAWMPASPRRIWVITAEGSSTPRRPRARW